MTKLNFSIIALFFCIVTVGLFVISPDICCKFAKDGLVLCSTTVIPSLFPITVCVVFIMKRISNIDLSFFDRIANRLFKLNTSEFLIFLFSLLGGFPTGARLIENAYRNKEISKNKAHILECFCVNAGPGFIIIAVGLNIFYSKKIGYILFLSHFLSALLMAFVSGFFIKDEQKPVRKTISSDIADDFTLSCSDSADTVLSVCAYVVFFSVIIGYLQNYGIRYLPCFLEVTTALKSTENLYFASFLLGFSGICVWCQILAITKNVGINFKLFFISRLLNGLLNSGFTFLFAKIFKISLPAVSIGNITAVSVFDNNISVFISLLLMSILLIISLENKKNGGNLRYDLLK